MHLFVCVTARYTQLAKAACLRAATRGGNPGLDSQGSGTYQPEKSLSLGQCTAPLQTPHFSLPVKQAFIPVTQMVFVSRGQRLPGSRYRGVRAYRTSVRLCPISMFCTLIAAAWFETGACDRSLTVDPSSPGCHVRSLLA